MHSSFNNVMRIILGMNLVICFVYFIPTVREWYSINHIHVSDPAIRAAKEPVPIDRNIVTKDYLVPNIVHFVWFGDAEWKFHQMLSVKSAFQNIKPDAILFHCDMEPFGYWWNYTKRHVSTLLIIKIERPTEIFGIPLRGITHMSDITRFNVIKKFGGIYLDTDVIALKSFNPLRKYNFTLGLENPGNLGSGVIIGEKNATFLNLWIDTYRNFSSNEWAYHACVMPYRLWLLYPHLIHVEKKTIQYPDWRSSGLKLLYDKIYDWSNNYSIHMWYRKRKRLYNPEVIKTLNSTFGQIARFIYFN